MVHVILAAAHRGFRDIISSGLLGANEQHAATAGDGITHGAQSAVHHRHGLLQIQDMHLVAHAEDVGRHAGIPAARMVAKMHPSFEQGTQRNDGHRHERFPSMLVRLSLRGAFPGEGDRTLPDQEGCAACGLPPGTARKRRFFGGNRA